MSARARRLEESARSLLGPGVAVSACRIGAAGTPLFPAEQAAIARDIPARRAEFTAGRQAARAAMSALGHAPAAIPMAADRAPLWPEGLTGSITHGDGLALAALAPVSTTRGLGLDLEPDTPLAADLWATILLPEERAWLETRPESDRGRLAKRVFSAKEAAYKAQYALTGTFLEFDDISISYTPDTHAFTAHLRRSAPPLAQGSTLPGQQTIREGLILSTLQL